jgi:Na+(H+)/acetate symporter ActP
MDRNYETPHYIPVTFFYLIFTLFSSNMLFSCLFSSQTPCFVIILYSDRTSKNGKIIVLLNNVRVHVFYNQNIRSHVLSLDQHALTA